MAIKELSDGGVDGTRLGQSSTDKIGFYGVTPVVQPSGSAQAALSTDILTLTGTYNSTILIAIFTAHQAAVNAHRSALVTLGLEAGA